jgi:hypothetical protein
MKFYFSAKVLDKLASVPHSSKRAMPTAAVYVRNAKVIIVKDAMYRNATFDGTFLLGDDNDLPLPDKGLHNVEVYCCWFRHRLKTSGLNFKVDMSTAKVINKYTGKVVSNLSIPKEEKYQPIAQKKEIQKQIIVDDYIKEVEVNDVKISSEVENKYMILPFWDFAILCTLMVAFFPWSLLFCVVFYGLQETKYIVLALFHDFIKTIIAVLSIVVPIFLLIIITVVFLS